MARRPIRYIDKNKTIDTPVEEQLSVPTRADRERARAAYIKKATDLFQSKSDKYALQEVARDRISKQKSYENSRTAQQKKEEAGLRTLGGYVTIRGNRVAKSALPGLSRGTWEATNMTDRDSQQQALNAKNLQRAKKGLPPLQGSYSRSKETRSGLAYNEIDPFEKAWKNSEEYKDFKSLENNTQGVVNRVDKYGKPLGSKLWKDGRFVGADDPNLSESERRRIIQAASGDPSLKREANMKAQRAKSLATAYKNRKIEDFGKRVAAQGLSEEAMNALMANVKASEESTERAQHARADQVARDEIANTRERFIEEQMKNRPKRQSAKQQRVEREEQALQERIDRRIEQTGEDYLTASKMVQREVAIIGKDKGLQDTVEVVRQLLASERVKPQALLESVASMPDVGGDIGKAKKVLQTIGLPSSDIEKQVQEYQKNVLGYTDEQINQVKRKKRIQDIYTQSLKGADLSDVELDQIVAYEVEHPKEAERFKMKIEHPELSNKEIYMRVQAMYKSPSKARGRAKTSSEYSEEDLGVAGKVALEKLDELSVDDIIANSFDGEKLGLSTKEKNYLGKLILERGTAPVVKKEKQEGFVSKIKNFFTGKKKEEQLAEKVTGKGDAEAFDSFLSSNGY